MIEITDEIKKEVLDYSCESEFFMEYYSDEFYAFYYKCLREELSIFDADRYAALNTLFDYDIGIDNAIEIIRWMFDNEEHIEISDVFELTEEDESKDLLKRISDELYLYLDFTNWVQKMPGCYQYFEE